MSFRRTATARTMLHDDELTAAMTGIGMGFTARGTTDPNIEDTLVSASEQGLLHDDLRTLAVLVTWLGVHSRMINVDRLTRLVRAQDSQRVRAFWSAVALWLQKDRRFARIAKLYDGPCLDLLSVGTNFQVKRHGEDPRFLDSSLRVPSNALRDRAADVLDPGELVKRHLGYRRRLVMGPSYRADMWAALEQEPTLSPSELARKTYGSFATAWQVKHDWNLLGAALGATKVRHRS